MPVLRISFILIFIHWFCFLSSGQSEILNFKHVKLSKELETLNSGHSREKKRGLGNALLTVYQQHISPLISADCIYDPSCSRFSRLSINKYGLIKGVLLTADRLTRCSSFCAKDIPDRKFNEEGVAEDNP
jgi:putative membrane protein insertion efficiency factor